MKPILVRKELSYLLYESKLFPSQVSSSGLHGIFIGFQEFKKVLLFIDVNTIQVLYFTRTFYSNIFLHHVLHGLTFLSVIKGAFRIRRVLSYFEKLTYFP